MIAKFFYGIDIWFANIFIIIIRNLSIYNQIFYRNTFAGDPGKSGIPGFPGVAGLPGIAGEYDYFGIFYCVISLETSLYAYEQKYSPKFKSISQHFIYLITMT